MKQRDLCQGHRPYEDLGASFKIGDELFITGKDQMIYFPRQEHAIVKYGQQEIHYAIAIPAGEARYVLDRNSGQIRLHKGPSIFLPDPRKEVIVRRVLDPRTVSLWFPGNREALEVNAQLKALQAQQGTNEYVVDTESAKRDAAPGGRAREEQTASKSFAGDDFTRSQTYTQPRTIVLNTRYDGAVAVDVWTGYAILVVSRTGERQVIAGPHTHLMEYDETLQRIELSTGTPKSDEHLYPTVYLRVLHNKVSDKIDAETRDLCQIHLSLSYRVNFEGDPGKWFNVENYVKFLTDHLRSRIRHAVKQQGIETFYGNAAAIVRDVVLGAQGEDGKRPGRHFEENGMRVYDVEVLDVTIGDDQIASLLVGAQQEAVRQALAIAAEQRKVTYVRESERRAPRPNRARSGKPGSSRSRRAWAPFTRRTWGGERPRAIWSSTWRSASWINGCASLPRRSPPSPERQAPYRRSSWRPCKRSAIEHWRSASPRAWRRSRSSAGRASRTSWDGSWRARHSQKYWQRRATAEPSSYRRRNEARASPGAARAILMRQGFNEDQWLWLPPRVRTRFLLLPGLLASGLGGDASPSKPPLPKPPCCRLPLMAF
jgi:hypothetical protein